MAGSLTSGKLVDGLAAALAETASLIRSAPGPLRVVSAASTPEGLAAVQHYLDLLTSRMRLPGLRAIADAVPEWSAEIALSRRLARFLDHDALERGPVADADVVSAADAAMTAFPGRPVVVRGADGIPLRCWATGREHSPAVVLVGACGMPVHLVAGWMRELSDSFRVLTWETRGMFAVGDGPGLPELRDHSLAAQACDLLAVLDGFGIARAHAMGLCGGAVIALAAAASSARVTSLSLWHGDYDLGGDAPKTEHQRDMESLLAMASRGQAQAASLYQLLRRPLTLKGLRPDIAHHLIYPYISPELLHRYGLLNGAIMSADCRPLLGIRHPALVVTSRTDSTAHPAGSELVAAKLPAAELRVLPEGDHLTAFGAGPELAEMARDYLTRVTWVDRRDT